MPITITASGNCNFKYITGLSYYKPDESEKAMRDLLTTQSLMDPFSKNKRTPTYQPINCGMYLFAQGSEDDPAKLPYADNFRKLIERDGLGTVYEIPPVPNPLHGGKKGQLFVWVIDHKACRAWWEKHVLGADKMQKLVDAVNNAMGDV